MPRTYIHIEDLVFTRKAPVDIITTSVVAPDKNAKNYFLRKYTLSKYIAFTTDLAIHGICKKINKSVMYLPFGDLSILYVSYPDEPK